MNLRVLTLSLLLLSPFVIYEAATFADYGFRDDYSITRETHEEPGKVLDFTASHGRPLYGFFLEASYRHVRSIDDLAWLRLLSVMLITGFGLLLFRQLRINGWQSFESAAVALTVTLLPASQVTTSWAVGWPWGISLILTVVGFGLCERAREKTGWPRAWRVICTIFFYMLATAIYQSDTLFAVVMLASVLLSPQPRVETVATVRRLLFHLSILLVALILSYGFLQILFSTGIFHESGRLQFETDVFSKLIWFLSRSLPNALAFLVLCDDFGTGATLFWCMVTVVIALVLLALYIQIKNKNVFNWLLCLLVLPWIAHAISLVAAERVLGYRTTYALSGLVIVILMAAIREVIPGTLRYIVISFVVVMSAVQAHQQSLHLIAEPQAREWSMVKDAVSQMQPGVPTMVYMIEPKPTDRSTDRVYRDEFGSFTTNSSWTPDEMFKLAMHQRFADGIPEGWHYEFYHGGDPPPATDHYDITIDMRTLKQWRK